MNRTEQPEHPRLYECPNCGQRRALDGEDQCQTCYIKLLERLLAEQKAEPEPVEAGEFTKRLRENYQTERTYWWCSTCKQELSPQEVTNTEYHEECGTYVGTCIEDEQLRQDIFEACDLIDRLTAENNALKAELEDWRNKEGSVCPEDVGFVEYLRVKEQEIKRLTAENKALAERIEKLENYLKADITDALSPERR
jgi:cell division protein FtsB